MVIFASIVTLAAIAGVLCWLLAPPIWQTISQNPEGEIPDSTRIELAKTVAELFLGVLVLGTLYFTWRRVTATERTVEVAQEGQITERFTRAIDQLGNEKVPIRLGGSMPWSGSPETLPKITGQ